MAKVTVRVPTQLAPLSGGERLVEVEAEPPTLEAALHALYTVYPGFQERIQGDDGEIRRHMNIFVGDDNCRDLGGLATQVVERQEIVIMPAVAGGAE